MLTQDHKTPKVDGELCVRFAGKRWSVRTVPDVMIGETLKVTYNPFNPACAYVLDADADGHELLIEIPEVLTDEHGFSEDAALIGREMKSQPDTRADTNRKLVERLATGTDTDEAAAAARKARTLPFAGALKPYAHHADVPDAVLLPRRGVALSANLSVAKAPARVFNVFEAAAELTRRGLVMTPELRAAMPANVTEDDLDAIAAQHAVRSGLRVVNGGVV